MLVTCSATWTRSRTWDAVISAEPALGPVLSGGQFDSALEAIADFVDLKSPYTIGHSRGVAELAAGAARLRGFAAGEVTLMRRSGLVHDLGPRRLQCHLGQGR